MDVAWLNVLTMKVDMLKKLNVLWIAIFFTIVLLGILKLLFFKSDFLSPVSEKNSQSDMIEQETELDKSKPYYLNEYYSIEQTDLFKIDGNENEVFEKLKYFDFEYFTYLDFDSKYSRVFYVLYSENDVFYLKRYHFSSDDGITINLPNATAYWLMTDTVPTMRAGIVETHEIEGVELSFFDSYSKGLRSQISAGGTTNPQKIMIAFRLMGNESSITYNDGEEVVVRTTQVHFIKE